MEALQIHGGDAAHHRGIDPLTAPTVRHANLSPRPLTENYSAVSQPSDRSILPSTSSQPMNVGTSTVIMSVLLGLSAILFMVSVLLLFRSAEFRDAEGSTVTSSQLRSVSIGASSTQSPTPDFGDYRYDIYSADDFYNFNSNPTGDGGG